MDQILSVCTGIGGLDLGLHAGLRAVGREARTVCMVEREAFPCAVLGKAIEEGWMDDAPLWLGDLRELPLDELPDIDWYTGGYPCQPFSTAGKRLGKDDPRHLWPIILEQLKSLRPGGVFFENVGGHISLGLPRVLQDLAGCGFRCAFGLWTAEEVGAPHRRERVFILGLADTDTNTRGQRESRRTSGGVSQDVAHDNGRGQPIIGQAHDEDGRFSQRNDADGCNTDLADADGAHRKRGGVSGRVRSEHADADGLRQLADADDCRSRENQLPAELRASRALESPEDHGIPSAGQDSEDPVWWGWPSRPEIPQAEWEPPRTIERGLGRNADGLPDRLDRLRSLGNAVVPQQAAKAFITLYKELEEWISTDQTETTKPQNG